MRVKTVKKSQRDHGSCSRCGDPLPEGSGYRWIKFRNSGKIKRCMKFSCTFRQSDLTQSDKLSRVYGASESVHDAVGNFVLEAHVSEILEKAQAVEEAVEGAVSEIEEVAAEYNESADNIEYSFEWSPTIDLCREKAESLESWQYEFETPKDTLTSSIGELEDYIGRLEAFRAEVGDADIIVTTVEGLTDLAMGDGELEPFDTSEIESAISEIEDVASSCPI